MIFLLGGTLDLNTALRQVVVLQGEQAEDGRAALELLGERKVDLPLSSPAPVDSATVDCIPAGLSSLAA